MSAAPLSNLEQLRDLLDRYKASDTHRVEAWILGGKVTAYQGKRRIVRFLFDGKVSSYGFLLGRASRLDRAVQS